jgi:hypothetical protein
MVMGRAHLLSTSRSRGSSGEEQIRMADPGMDATIEFIYLSRSTTRRSEMDRTHKKILGHRSIKIKTLRGQVKSSTNTPVIQGAKQTHIERRCDFELPRQSCRSGELSKDYPRYPRPPKTSSAPANKIIGKRVRFETYGEHKTCAPGNYPLSPPTI